MFPQGTHRIATLQCLTTYDKVIATCNRKISTLFISRIIAHSNEIGKRVSAESYPCLKDSLLKMFFHQKSVLFQNKHGACYCLLFQLLILLCARDLIYDFINTLGKALRLKDYEKTNA